MNTAKCRRNVVDRACYRLRLVIERPYLLSEVENQERLSKLLRRALLKDRKLVARVKADVPWFPDDVVCQHFTGPLAWLGDVWRRRERPRGRPYDPARHWAIVGAVEMLMQNRTIVPAEEGEVVFDPEGKEGRRAKPGEWKCIALGFGLTFTEVVAMLSGEPFPPGLMPPRRDGVPRPALTGEALNAIGEDVRKRLGYRVHREEIIRARNWARQQRLSGDSRWAGTRIRSRAMNKRVSGPTRHRAR